MNDVTSLAELQSIRELQFVLVCIEPSMVIIMVDYPSSDYIVVVVVVFTGVVVSILSQICLFRVICCAETHRTCLQRTWVG